MSQADTSRETRLSGGSEVHITRACDMCRKKKIRCEPTSDICIQCRRYKTQCHFTPIKVKRRPRRSNGQPRVDELEKRLKKMEEQLKAAASSRSQSSTEGESSPESMEVVRQETPHREHNEPMWSPHRAWGEEYPYRNTDYLRPASIPSTQNLVILSLTDGFAGLQDNYTRGDWNLTPHHSLFARRIFKPLPPKDEALRMIRIGFTGFNSAFPIFGQDSCIRMNEYSQDFSDPSWWACVNIVLSLGHRFDALRSRDNIAEDRKAWGYFQNALSVSTELSMLHSNLASIQALLGMAIIVQGIPNTNPFSSLLSAAIKLAHTMGLHRKAQPHGLSPSEIEIRKQVFWVAYFLDKDLSLRTGQPPNQDDDEMDVELPFQLTPWSRWCGPQDSECFFLARVQLARIQGQVYKRLMSIKASRQSARERASAVRELHYCLRKWKTTVPIDFESDYFAPTQEVPEVTPMMHTVTIRLSYFKTLSTIYRLSVPEQAEPVELVHELPPLITCVEEARKALKLLHVTPREDYGCIWVVLHVFVSATHTLLTNTISFPTSPLATLDLALIEPLLRLLGTLAKQGKSEEVGEMFARCSELWDQATRLVWLGSSGGEFAGGGGGGAGVGVDEEADVDIDALLQGNRGTGEVVVEKESVEDFIKRIERISQGSEEEGGFSNFGMFSG